MLLLRPMVNNNFIYLSLPLVVYMCESPQPIFDILLHLIYSPAYRLNYVTNYQTYLCMRYLISAYSKTWLCNRIRIWKTSRHRIIFIKSQNCSVFDNRVKECFISICRSVPYVRIYEVQKIVKCDKFTVYGIFSWNIYRRSLFQAIFMSNWFEYIRRILMVV